MLTNKCPIEVFADKLRRRSAEDQINAQRNCGTLSPRQLIDIDNQAAEILANATTLNAIKETKEGKVTSFASIDDFKKHMYEL